MKELESDSGAIFGYRTKEDEEKEARERDEEEDRDGDGEAAASQARADDLQRQLDALRRRAAFGAAGLGADDNSLQSLSKIRGGAAQLAGGFDLGGVPIVNVIGTGGGDDASMSSVSTSPSTRDTVAAIVQTLRSQAILAGVPEDIVAAKTAQDQDDASMMTDDSAGTEGTSQSLKQKVANLQELLQIMHAQNDTGQPSQAAPAQGLRTPRRMLRPPTPAALLSLLANSVRLLQTRLRPTTKRRSRKATEGSQGSQEAKLSASSRRLVRALW